MLCIYLVYAALVSRTTEQVYIQKRDQKSKNFNSKTLSKSKKMWAEEKGNSSTFYQSKRIQKR